MNLSPWLKRLLFWLLILGFPWGCLMLLMMSIYFALGSCGQVCSNENFIFEVTWWINRTWLIWIAGGCGFGFLCWIGIEINNKLFLPPKKALEESFHSETFNTGIQIIHIPQSYPPTRWLGKSPVAQPFIVVINEAHIVSFAQLTSTKISLEPGDYNLFVGFNNTKSWWKRSARTKTYAISIKAGEVQKYSLKWDARIMLRVKVWALFGVIALITEPVWLYPLLDSIPINIWKENPSLVQFVTLLRILHPISLLFFGAIIVENIKLFKAGSSLFLEPVKE